MLQVSSKILTMRTMLAAFLVVIFVLPVLVSQAQETSDAAATAEEDVVVSSSDQPLDRQAKLQRAWVVFREIDSPGIFAITKLQPDGKRHKREIQTLSFFTKFNANYHIKIVAKGRLDVFPTDAPIITADDLNPADFVKAGWKFRLIKAANNKAVYLVTPDGKKRPILSEGVFHRFGWEFRDVEAVSEAEVASLPQDGTVTDGTVFSEEVTVNSTEKRMASERLVKRLNLQKKTTVRARLVKAHNSPDIYVIDAKGMKHKIMDMRAAQRHKLNLQNTTEVTPEELAAIPTGTAIDEASAGVNLDATVSQ